MPTDLERQQAFHADLIKHKLIIPSNVQGVFGRGKVFEDVLQRLDDLITHVAKDDGAEVVHFPPIISKTTIVQSEFIDSFPHLAGSVFSFAGTEAQHKELVHRLHNHEPWSDLQTQTDVCLTPAACYPIYPTFTGTLPPKGKLVDLSSWCFRHEPSPDPARMQAFRVREFVRVGEPDVVIEWRQMWLDRGVSILRGLGLAANPDVASDPFFGRGGRLLAVNQKEQKLKFEVLVAICSDEKPTAVCSFNYHQDHFGSLFNIKTSDGNTAQTACLGFGMERCVMALFITHGCDVEKWPKDVREKLWP